MRRFLLVIILSLFLAVSLRAETTIVVLGDSLSAAYGIPPEKGWVTLLQEHLEQQGYSHQVINASINGETTAGGLARIDTLLQRHNPELLILELGGNDGLRGTSLDTIRSNLESMINRSYNSGAQVLLVGMQIPPSYGARYTREFSAIYQELSSIYNTPIVTDWLNEVGQDPTLMQSDGIHPNVKAQPYLLESIWKELESLLRADS
ncbi:arylesterase [Desulfurispira natronophila]|uniref:Acyl-CoA thioesterase-1 n=1 Tax=Desulfurispira natronophila TaxID=682562 RepID=A0A7W7Y2S1_9BACT|nr:arylesterase [Desulfurispira natronophila]MBB5020874.1 acyl-CoA thioesterase-1 [Desulfurispira natronophila]